MPYGEIRVDTITFTNGGVDTSITVSGLAASTTGNLTVTGTVSGTTANFVSGVFTTQISGATITGTTVAATTGTFTTVTGGTATITSGVFAAGSAAAPSVSFSSDPNTGIYSPGADQVAISTNGTGRLFVDASGNVGVGGTASTNGRLKINVASGSNSNLVFSENNTDRYLLGQVTGDNAFRVYDLVAASERLRITSAGLVGIGTSSPGARLSVLSADNVAATTIADFGANNGTSAIQLGYNRITQVNSTPAAAYLQLGVSNKADAIHIDGSGRVGIGTTSPQYKLHVSQTGSAVCFGESGSVATVIGTNAAGTASQELSLRGFPLTFTGNGGGGSEAARIDSSGRLLIGTSSSRAVNASIAALQLQIEGTTYQSSSMSLVTNQNAADGSYIVLGKSRGATLNSSTIVNSGDSLGALWFCGADGNTMPRGAVIEASVDGTPGASDMPGRLTFATTADGSITPTERLCITSAGLVGVGLSSPTALLESNQNIGFGTGGTFAAGQLYSDPNWGVILRAKQASPGVAEFAFQNAGGTERFRVTGTGTFNIKGAGDGTTTQAVSFNGSAPVNSLVIDSSGRLLVGTSTIVAGTPQTIVEKSSSDLDILRVQCGVESAGNLAGIAFGFAPNGARPKTAIASVSTGSYGMGSLVFYVDQAFDNDSVSSSDEVARFDTSGRLLVGTSTARSQQGVTPRLQVENTDYDGLGLIVNSNTSSDRAPVIVMGRSRGTSLNGSTSVINNDRLAAIFFQGADGTDIESSAGSIECYVDGVTGSNDMPGRLVFSTTADGASSPTERMRISRDGAAFLVADVAYTSCTVSSTQSAGTAYAIFAGKHSATSGASDSGTASILIYTNGNVVNANNSYGAISDIKLKENIVDANSQWDDLKALQVRKYNFKEGQTHTQIGLVAQEVELVSPGLVSESPDRDAEGNDLGTVTKSVNYSVLYMKAVKALQEAMERIETLEAKVAALEGA